MSNLQDLINSRRSIYKFTDEVVNRDIVEQALVAASNAPSHKHTHPWKFYSIGEKARISLLPDVKRLAEIKSRKKGSQRLEEDLQRAVEKILNVPVLFAITSKRNPSDLFREKEDYAATVCALHNMVLSFWGNGVAAKWSTGAITRHSETYAHLNIDATAEEIIGFVKAGYPETIPEVRKPPVEEHTVRLP